MPEFHWKSQLSKNSVAKSLGDGLKGIDSENGRIFCKLESSLLSTKKFLLTIYQNYPLEIRGYETCDDDGDIWGKKFSDDGNEKEFGSGITKLSFVHLFIIFFVARYL